MSDLKEFFQNEADQLLPSLGIHIIFWGDDPIDTVAEVTGKLLHLNKVQLAQLHERLEHDEDFRERTGIHDLLTDYNAGSGIFVTHTTSLGNSTAHLVCLNVSNETAVPLKQAGIIHPGYPDFAIDIEAMNYQAFAHEIGHPALYKSLGIDDHEFDEHEAHLHLKNAVKAIHGVNINEQDLELFEERVIDLFACGLTAQRLERKAEDIAMLISKMRMIGIVHNYSFAGARDIASLNYAPPSHYTSPVLDKFGAMLADFSGTPNAYALMRKCVNLCAKDYDPLENAGSLFKTAHDFGLFARTMDIRFAAARKIFARHWKEPALSAAGDFAARYVRAEKSMLDLCRKRESDAAARQRLTEVRSRLAVSLRPKRNLSQMVRSSLGLFRGHGKH